eukprot:Nitzschia sp. Nitz4//scaffold89_size161592//205//3093//NITZ4_002358-RA/size161592-processed-gene-0.210-mRNA-1//-1//CDS//3329559556//1960//frame0
MLSPSPLPKWNVSFLSLALWTLFAHQFLFLPVNAGYEQTDEAAYMANLEAHLAASHADADQSPLLAACRMSPAFVRGPVLTVHPTSESSNVVTSTDVQEQCHESYLCVIPTNVTLLMTTSLHVGALHIDGHMEWNDVSQLEEEAYLCAGYVVAGLGASIHMSLESPNRRAWVYLTANGARHDSLGWRFFGGLHSSLVEIKGRPMRRTWSLLDQPMSPGDITIKVLHDPIAMGWRIGDRIGIAPTEEKSDGTGQTFTIVHMALDGTILLDQPCNSQHKAEFLASPPTASQMPPILMSAEVVNLSRNIVITGDDFQTVPCDPQVTNPVMGCQCNSFRSTCTVGLHTISAYSGVMRVSHTRVEKCGQRGIMGKYCLHFHMVGDCPDCLAEGNAIEFSHQRGITVHGTHRALVKQNVLWNVRGAGVYVEDGNEMHNSIEHNVVVCPFPIDDDVHHGCTLPGTDNASSDSRTNQAGFYLKSSTNALIGNRAANSRNGMFAEAGANGAASGEVCHQQTLLGRWEGNTFHGHQRFGTYPIKFFPQETDRSVETNGFNIDRDLCYSFDINGETRGISTAIVNHVDYDNIFVGQYELGDVQYVGHASINNKNLIYWKESKNFENGCSAHISKSYYSDGNLALPDQATVIIEDTMLKDVSLEANHHCKVGTTGYLCMPQYILHNVEWYHSDPTTPWLYFQEGTTEFGGIFSLSPDYSSDSSPFPPGYVSLVSEEYKYLLKAPNSICVSSDDLGMGIRYDHGILCKRPLRSLKIYSQGMQTASDPPSLKVKVWFDNPDGVASHSKSKPSAAQWIPYHQVGDDGKTNRQGYSLPVFPLADVSYRLSLASSNNGIPEDWIVEFSDPVMGNRWGEEFINLELVGRPCINGGVVSNYHDRRFIYGGSDFLDDQAWGEHGACVAAPEMEPQVCDSESILLDASECPELCLDGCSSDNFYCDCRTASCQCKLGFIGDDCS